MAFLVLGLQPEGGDQRQGLRKGDETQLPVSICQVLLWSLLTRGVSKLLARTDAATGCVN